LRGAPAKLPRLLTHPQWNSHCAVSGKGKVSNITLAGATVTQPVETRQIAPTILQVLGLDPNQLQAVLPEKTQVLPDLPY